MLFAKIKLFKTHNGIDLEEANMKGFDKTILNYKKHFLCFTKNEIIFIGYSPISKNSNDIPKMYKKEYKLDNIDNIQIYYTIEEYTNTHHETRTTYRKIIDDYGYSHTEEIREQVPVETKNTLYNVLYGCIYFKNTLAQQAYFDFSDVNKNFWLADKTSRVCKKLNIAYTFQRVKED